MNAPYKTLPFHWQLFCDNFFEGPASLLLETVHHRAGTWSGQKKNTEEPIAATESPKAIHHRDTAIAEKNAV
jgi:hypothetical protein